MLDNLQAEISISRLQSLDLTCHRYRSLSHAVQCGTAAQKERRGVLSCPG